MSLAFVTAVRAWPLGPEKLNDAATLPNAFGPVFAVTHRLLVCSFAAGKARGRRKLPSLALLCPGCSSCAPAGVPLDFRKRQREGRGFRPGFVAVEGSARRS